MSTKSPGDFYGKSGVHGHPSIRTGTTSNMGSFSNAFNCPVDSPINRKPKCSLWKQSEEFTDFTISFELSVKINNAFIQIKKNIIITYSIITKI